MEVVGHQEWVIDWESVIWGKHSSVTTASQKATEANLMKYVKCNWVVRLSQSFNFFFIRMRLVTSVIYVTVKPQCWESGHSWLKPCKPNLYKFQRHSTIHMERREQTMKSRSDMFSIWALPPYRCWTSYLITLNLSVSLFPNVWDGNKNPSWLLWGPYE